MCGVCGGEGVGSPNNFSSKRVQFSLWFVINCTPRHCGVEDPGGGGGGALN